MRKRDWNTYAVHGYSYQAGTDPRATGGVHLLEVRQDSRGQWWDRVVDSNGRFASPSRAAPLTTDEGEALYALARRF